MTKLMFAIALIVVHPSWGQVPEPIVESRLLDVNVLDPAWSSADPEALPRGSDFKQVASVSVLSNGHDGLKGLTIYIDQIGNFDAKPAALLPGTFDWDKRGYVADEARGVRMGFTVLSAAGIKDYGLRAIGADTTKHPVIMVDASIGLTRQMISLREMPSEINVGTRNGVKRMSVDSVKSIFMVVNKISNRTYDDVRSPLYTETPTRAISLQTIKGATLAEPFVSHEVVEAVDEKLAGKPLPETAKESARVVRAIREAQGLDPRLAEKATTKATRR